MHIDFIKIIVEHVVPMFVNISTKAEKKLIVHNIKNSKLLIIFIIIIIINPMWYVEYHVL